MRWRLPHIWEEELLEGNGSHQGEAPGELLGAAEAVSGSRRCGPVGPVKAAGRGLGRLPWSTCCLGGAARKVPAASA